MLQLPKHSTVDRIQENSYDIRFKRLRFYVFYYTYKCINSQKLKRR